MEPGSDERHAPHVRRERWLRWLAVAAGAAVLLSVPALGRVVARAGAAVDPGVLRERILASAAQPYSGYAESVGQLGVPPLPQLDDVAALLSGTVRMRAWYAAPDRWRVDDVTTVGERGTYRDGGGSFVWDFEENRLTEIRGQPPVRPPAPQDLLPPELGRRLLALATTDPVSRLPARRVAGVDAAGLRLVPADPDTTVGAVRVWADPASGLPLQVEVAARGADRPVLSTRLLELDLGTPPDRVLTPTAAPGSGHAVAEAADVEGVLRGLGNAALPERLAGRARTGAGPAEAAALTSVGRYGAGLSSFVVIPLGRSLANRLIDGARNGGGAEIRGVSAATALRLQTPLVTVAVVRVRRSGYLLAGAVTAPVLERAAVELTGGSR